MFILLFLLLIVPAYADDIDVQIESLDTQAKSLLDQRKALLDDWNKNDPDLQMLKRLREKTDQQRALADQANELLRQKKELIDKSVD